MSRIIQTHLTQEDCAAIDSIRAAGRHADRSAAIREALSAEAERLALGVGADLRKLSAAVAFSVAGQAGRRCARRLQPHDTLFNLRVSEDDEDSLNVVMEQRRLKQGEAIRYSVRMYAATLSARTLEVMRG